MQNYPCEPKRATDYSDKLAAIRNKSSNSHKHKASFSIACQVALQSGFTSP